MWVLKQLSNNLIRPSENQHYPVVPGSKGSVKYIVLVPYEELGRGHSHPLF